MKLYLMRHCATDDGAEMTQSRPLNDTGEMQAHAMRKFMKLAEVDPDVIISSDFTRARQTAGLVRRGDTPIKTTPFLQPAAACDDKYVASAIKSILKLAGDAKTVLVVTHGPLIQRLLAAVAFNFQDENWGWEHGALAYVNTGDSRFRWFVTPKLAAHVTGAEEPKDVENEPLTEAERVELKAFCHEALKLAGNLRRAHKAAAVDPLIATVKAATQRRFRKQRARVLHAVRRFAGSPWTDINYVPIRMKVQAAISFNDPNFANSFNMATSIARGAGAAHVSAQIGLLPTSPFVASNEGAKRAVEASDQPRRSLSNPLPPGQRSAKDLEGELDHTTDAALGAIVTKAFQPGNPLTISATLDAMKQAFAQYIDGVDGQLSRSDTVARSEISAAYHGGGADVVKLAPHSRDIEKQWSVQDNPCPTCIANAAMGWILADQPFDSGDDTAPAHPNCMCSVDYQSSAPEEAE